MTRPSTRLMSHWQQGCDDAKHGRGPKRPFPNAELLCDYVMQEANRGYMNGYRFGLTRRYEPVHDEGSLP